MSDTFHVRPSEIAGLSPEGRASLEAWVRRVNHWKIDEKPKGSPSNAQAVLSFVAKNAIGTREDADGTRVTRSLVEGGSIEIREHVTTAAKLTAWDRVIAEEEELQERWRKEKKIQYSAEGQRILSRMEAGRDLVIEQLREEYLPKRPVEPAPAALPVDAWVKLAAGSDSTRLNLTCPWNIKGGRQVATDGHRLHIKPRAHSSRARNPVATNPEIRIAKHDFPNVDQIIPSNSEAVLLVDADKLRAGIKTAIAGMTSDRREIALRMESMGTILTLSASHPDVGHTRVPVDLLASRNTGLRALNARYLLDAIKGAAGTLRLVMADELSPVVIDRADGGKALIMPLGDQRRVVDPVKPAVETPNEVALVAATPDPEVVDPPIDLAARRSAAALKAVATRRARLAGIEPAPKPAVAADRSAAALKAWETRRRQAA